VEADLLVQLPVERAAAGEGARPAGEST